MDGNGVRELPAAGLVADQRGGTLCVRNNQLARLRRAIPDRTLTLPGHDMPLRGLHRRLDELADHHVRRCDMIVDLCREAPRSVAEIAPHLFRRKLDDHQMSFAFAETLAHVNRLLREGRLNWVEMSPVRRARAA